MKIEEEKRETCPTCERQGAVLKEAKYGCDCCRKPIRRNRSSIDHLSVTVFNVSGHANTKRLEFCSWECVLVGLEDVKCDYFIELPYLQFDSRRKGMTAKDFFKAIAAYTS